MKIALTTGGNNLEAVLDPRFGRCENFLIYDLENKDFECIDNKGKNASGGAGISAAQQMIDKNVNAIITGNMGPNAFEIINKSGVKVYKGEIKKCDELIQDYNSGNMQEITEAGPAHMGMGRGNRKGQK